MEPIKIESTPKPHQLSLQEDGVVEIRKTTREFY
jgi:hypothetical protein